MFNYVFHVIAFLQLSLLQIYTCFPSLISLHPHFTLSFTSSNQLPRVLCCSFACESDYSMVKPQKFGGLLLMHMINADSEKYTLTFML
jgi:hypothetical protein